MDKIEPGQLGGLVFAVGIIALAAVLFNWRDNVLAGARLVAALLRDAFRYFVYVNWDRERGGIETEGDGIEPPVPEVVLPHQEAVSTGTRIPVREELSRAELLDILARQRADGRYVFSGNKLAELFANTPHAVSRNVLLEEIAAIRKAEQPSAPKPAARLERPVNGW